jgi:hypothetical protein
MAVRCSIRSSACRTPRPRILRSRPSASAHVRYAGGYAPVRTARRAGRTARKPVTRNAPLPPLSPWPSQPPERRPLPPPDAALTPPPDPTQRLHLRVGWVRFVCRAASGGSHAEARRLAEPPMPQLQGLVRASAMVGGALRDLPHLLAALRHGTSARRPPRRGQPVGTVPRLPPSHTGAGPAVWTVPALHRGGPAGLPPSLSARAVSTAPG